jgi:hypothetical protein
MFVDDCSNCKLVIGPCDGSIFIRTSKNCTISVVSKQLRFRDCQNLKIFTYCPSDPVIEASSEIYFAPFNAFFPKLKELFIKAKFEQSKNNLIKETNNYKAVYDFSEKTKEDRHWDLLPQDQIIFLDEANDDGQNEPLYEDYYEEVGYARQERLEVNPVTNEQLTSAKSDNFNEVVGNVNQLIHANSEDLKQVEENVNQPSKHEPVSIRHFDVLNIIENNTQPVSSESHELAPTYVKNDNIIINPILDSNVAKDRRESMSKTIDEYFIVTNQEGGDNHTNTNGHHNFLIVDQFDSEDHTEEMIALKRRQKKQEELHTKVLQKMEMELKAKNQQKQAAMDYVEKFNKYYKSN